MLDFATKMTLRGLYSCPGELTHLCVHSLSKPFYAYHLYVTLLWPSIILSYSIPKSQNAKYRNVKESDKHTTFAVDIEHETETDLFGYSFIFFFNFHFCF